MTREEVLKKIQENQNKLKEFGVKRLQLFGSHAHDRATPDSDLDFIVEFEENSFDAYMGLKLFLEDLFHRRVDLVLPDTIKPRLRQQILDEAVDAA